MAITSLLLLFFGGLLVLFLTGRLLGHIFGLDKYFRSDDINIRSRNFSSKKKKGKTDKKVTI